MSNVGPKWAPFVFMCFHCCFFSVGHILALASFYSMWVHSILMFLWLSIMVWNGSGYYVKYFTYTHRLEKLQEE